MKWCRETAVERSTRYTDWCSEDGEWVCAEGYDEHAKKQGRPYALLRRERGKLVKVACFATLAEAKRAAEEL